MRRCTSSLGQETNFLLFSSHRRRCSTVASRPVPSIRRRRFKCRLFCFEIQILSPDLSDPIDSIHLIATEIKARRPQADRCTTLCVCTARCDVIYSTRRCEANETFKLGVRDGSDEKRFDTPAQLRAEHSIGSGESGMHFRRIAFSPDQRSF